MILHKYSAEWIDLFLKIKSEIEASLIYFTCYIEHVGSTSVPNLDAKPIIDIDIVYTNKLNFQGIKSRLESLGYYHNGDQGIEGRDVFKRTAKRFNPILDTIKHHLYVCPSDSSALERHIFSRNYLRENDWARIKYQQMKYDLAEMARQNRKVYADLKELHVNEFIDFMINEIRQSGQKVSYT